jgi:hypothetical protein
MCFVTVRVDAVKLPEFRFHDLSRS